MITNFHNTFIKVKDILVVLFLPIFFTLLFGYVYSNTYVERIPFAILDLDESPSSRMIIDQFSEHKGMDVIGTVSTQDELKDLILSNQIYGGLVIPDHFDEDIKAKQSPDLLVLMDGTNLVIGNNLHAYTTTIINTLGVGVQMSILEGGSIVPYNAEQYLTALSFTSRMLYDPQMGYFLYVFAGILGILIQQTYLSVLSSRLLESKNELAQNPYQSSIGFPNTPLLQSILRLLCLSTVSFFLCLLFANKVYGYPLRGDTLSLFVLVVLFLIDVTAMGILITSFFDDEAHCAQFCMFLSVPTFLTSGYIWPEFMMAPHFASIIKSIWPLYYFVNPLRGLCMKNASFSDILPYLIGSAMFAAVWLTLSILLFRYRIRLMRKTKSDNLDICKNQL
ncbi:ABC transporter permease [Anaerovorax sp. IOR16]|uniref:ABC transporter permease n=1 Tax=Anaerovorax sp. IOR16 TaxID=2773458 RepID=UPI0019CF636C|nr:ABC transporter permease [Anaerovorax sp. IOR16]